MPSVNPPATPESLLRQEILALQAYPVPASAGMVKLDAMENPYPLPPQVREEIARLVADAAINRYPDAGAERLKEQIRATNGLPQDMGVLLGNGSDELIQLLALAVNKPGAVLLGVEPSFVMYKMIAAFAGMEYAGVPLTKDFELDLPATLAAIQSRRPALIFLAYPNNPTGNLFNAQAIMQIVEAAPGLVIMDEAYYAFAGASPLPMLASYPNVLVMRTFSKLGMAGLRLGFLAGSNAWLGQLEKLRLPYNVGVLTQLVAERLLQHYQLLQQQAAQIRQDRAWLYGRLQGMAGVQPYASEANFILFRVTNAGRIFENLKKRNVLIKNLSDSHALLAGCLRVTVGMPGENELFVQALQESMAG